MSENLYWDTETKVPATVIGIDKNRGEITLLCRRTELTCHHSCIGQSWWQKLLTQSRTDSGVVHLKVQFNFTQQGEVDRVDVVKERS